MMDDDTVMPDGFPEPQQIASLALSSVMKEFVEFAK